MFSEGALWRLPCFWPSTLPTARQNLATVLKFGGESSSSGQALRPAKIGYAGCGDSLAFERRRTAMRLMWPISVSLEMKRTRTTWQVTIRVQFNI
jgi:hypothetical protein